jgi:hypothetical protein
LTFIVDVDVVVVVVVVVIVVVGGRVGWGCFKILHCREYHCNFVERVTEILHVSFLNLRVSFK